MSERGGATFFLRNLVTTVRNAQSHIEEQNITEAKGETAGHSGTSCATKSTVDHAWVQQSSG